MLMQTKVCASCHKKKGYLDFYKSSKNNDGLCSYCKECNNTKTAAFQKTKKGKIILACASKKMSDVGYYKHGKGAISALKKRAKKRGLSFDLTAESLEDWWYSKPDICHYCGIIIEDYIKIRDFVINYKGYNFKIKKFKRFFKSPIHQKINTMTKDRVDNSIGYEISNIVKSCWICNSLKSDFLDGEQTKSIMPKIISELKSEIEIEKCKPAISIKSDFPKNKQESVKSGRFYGQRQNTRISNITGKAIF